MTALTRELVDEWTARYLEQGDMALESHLLARLGGRCGGKVTTHLINFSRSDGGRRTVVKPADNGL
jgi:hypothetical protein